MASKALFGTTTGGDVKDSDIMAYKEADTGDDGTRNQLFSVMQTYFQGTLPDSIETNETDIDALENLVTPPTKAGCQLDINGRGYVAGESSVVDHSGIQNPATATDIEPVDSEYGKLLNFNGETSCIEFDNPVVGTTGTFRFIMENYDDVSEAKVLADNRDSGLDSGVAFIGRSAGEFKLTLYGALDSDDFNTGIIITDVNMITVVVSDTLLSAYADGEFISSQAVTCDPVVSLNNLILGCKYSGTNYLDADLSFYYTTEEWTADEVLSDYNNQTHQNNIPMSQTATANTINMHDGNGHTLMEFETKTATSEGNQGAIAFDATNVYFCIADSSWMTIPLEAI